MKLLIKLNYATDMNYRSLPRLHDVSNDKIRNTNLIKTSSWIKASYNKISLIHFGKNKFSIW